MACPLDDTTKAAVRAWMHEHQYFHFSYWRLAEACAAALALEDADRDHPTPEAVYEIALEFYPDC